MPVQNAKTLFEKGLSHYEKGEYGKASEFFKEGVIEDPEFHECLYNLACCYSMMGDKNNALVYLNRAAKLHIHCIDWAKEDKELDNIRKDPLFKKILNNLGGESFYVDEEAEETAEEDIEKSEEEDFQEMIFEEVESEEAVNQAAVSEEPAETLTETPGPSEPPPPLEDKKKKSKPKKEKNTPESKFPPCACCEGIVDSELRLQYDPKLMLIVVVTGMFITFSLSISILGLLGFPIIVVGLYFLIKT